MVDFVCIRFGCKGLHDVELWKGVVSRRSACDLNVQIETVRAIAFRENKNGKGRWISELEPGEET